MRKSGGQFHLLAWVAAVGVCTGCGGRPILGPIGAQSHSYIYQDEDVKIRLLSKAELLQPPPGVTAGQWSEHLAKELPGIYGNTAQAIAAAPLVALAVGFAVDQVKSEIEKEAELYEAQFDATLYDRGFWDVPPDTQTGVPHFYGFELLRTVRGFDQSDRPAYRLICGIAPANALPGQGISKTDERIFAVKPLFFQTRAAKAKVLWPGRRINSKIDLAFDATWIDRDQNVHQERIATANFEFKNYDLVAAPPLTTELHALAGWFAGIPISYDSQGNPKGNGAFKVTAIVTESDQSQAKQTLERISKYLGEKKQTIVNAATQPFNK